MGTNEKFCLRWNDFENNISVAFRDLREEKDFFDLTLSCGARQVQAHRLILSACSPFFRTILKQNPHQHPLLYLKGISFNDLQSVLSFMYHGEVNVAQEELNSFLSVAEELQVKGLTQSNIPSTPSTTTKTASPTSRPRSRPAPRQSADPAPQHNNTKQHMRALDPSHQRSSYQQQLQEEVIEEITPLSMVKTEPLTAAAGNDHPVGFRENTGTEVANMEESYGEPGYADDDYALYEGEHGQGYGGHEQYEVAGQSGKKFNL